MGLINEITNLSKYVGDLTNNVFGATAQQANAERLANTEQQRKVADLKAAGLNPVLAMNAQGASSPTVGTSGQSLINPVLEAINTSMAYSKNEAEIANINSQTKAQEIDNITKPEQNRVNIALTRAQTGTAKSQAELNKAVKALTKKQEKLVGQQTLHEEEKINMTKAQAWDQWNENKYHNSTGTAKDMNQLHKGMNGLLGSLMPNNTNLRPKY